MSAPAKKRPADAEANPSAVRQDQGPRIGDMVLYAHRSRDGFTLVPMVVTRVHQSSTTIDGVVLCAEPYLMPNNAAAKPIRGVRQGTSEGTWQPRQ